MPPPRLPTYTGVVSSLSTSKTAKVLLPSSVRDSHLRKTYTRPTAVLTHDPNSSLRTGDVVAIQPGWRTSKHKRFVLSAILAPFGTEGLESRPRVLSREELVKAREKRREEKRTRKVERGVAEEKRERDEERIRERRRKNAESKKRKERRGMEAAESAGAEVAVGQNGKSQGEGRPGGKGKKDDAANGDKDSKGIFGGLFG
jgi:small subunit ribosomal protein S17